MIRAVKDVQKGMLRCSRIWNEYYILKMDVAKYFKSIDRNILFKIISRKVKDEKLLWLIKEIVFSGTADSTGIAIGNYTSQVFANVYLNELDQYIKRELKIKYYYRYMDDSVILVKNKQEAKKVLNEIKIFLKNNLKLELNSKTQIFKSMQGVNFCGYKINEFRLKIRDRGKKKLKKKIKYLKSQIKCGRMNSREAQKLLCGHIGYIQCVDVCNLTNKLFYRNRDKS